jgi:hypothetical protein
VAQDRDLQAIARARVSSPDDPALGLRHALALSRAGEIGAAEALLVSALDLAPGEPDLTTALDAIGGGRARGAPWPSERGNARRSARSGVEGPSRGEVVHREDLPLDSQVEGFAVLESGQALALTVNALYSVTGTGDTKILLEIPRDRELRSIVLLPAGRIALLGRTHALVLVPKKGGAGFDKVAHRCAPATSFAVGASGFLYTCSRQGRVDAFPIAVPAEARTICRFSHDAVASLALAPGGDLIVAVGGRPEHGTRPRLERLSPEGETRFALELDAENFGKTVLGPVVDRDGVVFCSLPGSQLWARDAAGEPVFELPYRGDPAALAGEGERWLVCREKRTLRLLDARTGAEHASTSTGDSAFFGYPKVDARGFVYAQRGDDLIAWDPGSPGALVLEVKGLAVRHWDFAFAGGGRAFVFARVGAATQMIVVE